MPILAQAFIAIALILLVFMPILAQAFIVIALILLVFMPILAQAFIVIALILLVFMPTPAQAFIAIAFILPVKVIIEVSLVVIKLVFAITMGLGVQGLLLFIVFISVVIKVMELAIFVDFDQVSYFLKFWTQFLTPH